MIYLDNAATTKVKEEVISIINDTMSNVWGNPSSAYQRGMDAKQILENARETIAASINAKPNEIIFTSGASESNALAIMGYLNKKANDFVTTTIEHSSILNIPLKPHLMFKMKCDSKGVIHSKALEKAMDNNRIYRPLVSIQMANNEIGTIQNIKDLSYVTHMNRGIFHTDACQAVGHIPINVKELGIDMLSCSGHKIGAPKGIGFLYVNENIELSPIIYGTQEWGIRGGTENIPYIVGLSKAMELIDLNKQSEITILKDTLISELNKLGSITFNGDLENSLPGIVNFTIDNISLFSQQIVALFDQKGICVSSGSSCHSYSSKPSHVLKAIGLNDEKAFRSIRVSIGESNTHDDIYQFIKVLKNITNTFKIS